MTERWNDVEMERHTYGMTDEMTEIWNDVEME